MNVMLDLETWGNSNNAMIVSLGAVLFSDKEVLEKINIPIDPRSSVGTIEPDTMMWWVDPAQRAALDRWLSLPHKQSLDNALMQFSQFVPEGASIWGNGATFDNVILRSAYKSMDKQYPVPFWMDRCYRTVKAMYPDVKLRRVGIHHDAADDAESQALHLIEINKVAGGLL